MNFKTTALEYKYIPPNSGDCKYLLILVHGRTGNLRLLEWYSKRFKIDELGFICVQAPYPDRRLDQADEGFSWYLEKYQGLDESRQKILKMVEELKSQGMSAENTFWLGFSQGSVMILDLALRGPYKFGGFLCISGFCISIQDYPKAFGPFAKKQNILISHGTRDEIISYKKTKAVYDQLAALGVNFDFRTYDKPHSFHMQKEIPELETQLKEWIASK
ncbi:MAG: dienelactone hydrolase family protein [Deltaproteobacteria bacterium]|nr:dienelactone hydrolase family protein [Deltaproteobacteria bacterium]